MKDQTTDRDIKVIHQFLLDHNFDNTAKTLIQEASEIGFQDPECKSGDLTDPYIQLTQCYNTGDYLTFFQLWNNLFSESVRKCEEYKKLTFYLHVYFAILSKQLTPEISESLKWSSMEGDSVLEICKENSATEIEKINNSMKQLQDYLSDDGKELEHDAELRPFYALPSTENLHADAFFSKILEQRWSKELSEKLDSFISNHRQNSIDSSDPNCNKARLEDLPQISTTAPATETKAAEAAQNKITRDNVPIVPNDRDIPIFLKDNDSEEYDFCHRTNRSLRSRGTQTHITGDQITIDDLQGDRLELSSESLLKIHRQDKRLMQCNQELALTKTHLCSIHANYEKLKLRFHKLHADYHKLIDVSGELTVALENSVKGKAVDIQRTLEICMKIFPDLFNHNIRETSYPSLLQLGYSDITDTALPKLDIAAVSLPPKLLDFKKIKLHLLNGDVKTKLLLLQALRWKITLAQSGEQDEVLHEYISRDLLGLHGQIASDNGKLVLPCLLTAGEAYARHLLQQFAARLLNTLASFKCGRDYLSVGSTVINVTFACLDNNYDDGVDPYACDMMVAMLQKLSLRRQQRIYMIESGLLEWLINHLHDKCRVISLYRLEYAAALLMNLSLHRLAQARASKISSLLISTLLVLLSMDHASSLPYINGALNNFLSNPVINEEAKKMKRSDITDYLGRDQKIAEIRKHLDYILRMQRHESIDALQNGEETADDDNEQLDVVENELDENDPLKNYVGELNGETLLAMCYSVSSRIPQDPITSTDTVLQKISTTSTVDLYNNQHNNHLCDKRPSYLALRYNVEIKNDVSSKEDCARHAVFTKQVSNLLNSTLEEQQIVKKDANKELSPANKVRNVVKGFNNTETPLVMTCESRVYGKQNKNLFSFNNVAYPPSAIISDKGNRNQFDHDDRVRTRLTPKFEITNIMQDSRLKLRESKLLEDRSDNRTEDSPGRLRDEKFKRINLEKLLPKAVTVFKRNFSKKLTTDDAVYLYENPSSKDCDEIAATSALTLVSSCENGRKAEAEKFSSIASLNINNYDSNVVNEFSWKDNLELAKEEEAFLAKPKISRTPP